MEQLAQHGYKEYVEHCQCMLEECLNAMPSWVEVSKRTDTCKTIVHTVARCVVEDFRLAIEKKQNPFPEWSGGPNFFEKFLRSLAHASFAEQLVIILFMVIMPMFVGASIYIYFRAGSGEEQMDNGQEYLSLAPLDDNAGFSRKEKDAIQQDTATKCNTNRNKHHFLDAMEGIPLPLSSPSRAPKPKLPSVAPQKRSPLHLDRRESVHTPEQHSPEQHSPEQHSPEQHSPEQHSPRKTLWTTERRDEDRRGFFSPSPRNSPRSSPRGRTRSDASQSAPEDDRTVEYSDAPTDFEYTDSKMGDTQDLPYVLRQCVTNPRALVGWRILLPTIGRGIEGVVLSTVKRPFNATKFMVEMEDGSVEQYALQRSPTKAGVPFALLEKVQ